MKVPPGKGLPPSPVQLLTGMRPGEAVVMRGLDLDTSGPVWFYRPGSDLYIVYNDLHQTGLPTDAFAPNDKQFVVKLNFLLQR